jgi:hypothetical protein
MQTNIVVGAGQIGTAIRNILDCDIEDIDFQYEGMYDVIHICFGYSENFVKEVKKYQALHMPRLTIIHSTVPVGTSAKLGAVHSPCRGVHPHLEEGIRTFVKFFGGPQAEEAAAIFSEKGITCEMTPLAATTEFLKLYDTEQYRDAIVREKQMHEDCQKLGVDFEIAYTRANTTYNEGYETLGMPQYKKYVLEHREGPIGGHCVEPNHGIIQATGK